MLRTHYSSQITPQYDGKTVTVAGWVAKIRDIGKVKFLILRDKEGEVQIIAKKGDILDSLVDTITSLTRESVVSVTGKVIKNKDAPGGFEIVPEKINVLAKAEAPLPLETDPNIKSELDTRINFRYLDLRRKEVSAIFRIKDVVHRSFIKYLEAEGFILAHVPCVVSAATEGGTNLFPISYFENEAFLSQSPQLYKQMLMASGLDKVLIVTPVFRAEEHNTTRHLNESTQMDIEVAFVEDEQGALKYIEGAVNFIYKEVVKECKEQLKILGRTLDIPLVPFKQLTYTEALDVLKKDGINIKWGDDIPPEGERALCKNFNPLLVTKWPTDVRAFYSMPEPGNEKICRAYDLLIDGMEISSGAQRIHNYNILVSEMKRRKMNPKNFEFYLNAFKYGMPPHAGWSIGLERLTYIICGLKNIREAMLWPRDRTRLTP
ncbi:MAG: aspartate--tRNA(Asn) ligase [Candidatus Aenigmarchaeota archaeon]|nr:aspartate--tRNA(Asn) ligase [Candidatus Aenigmarchaeota archaeon]